MVTGGYNIIDFKGKQFNTKQNITVDSSIVDKLKDITKPCVVGNFNITHEDTKAFYAPSFAEHYIVSGVHAHLIGDIAITVTGDTTIMFDV